MNLKSITTLLLLSSIVFSSEIGYASWYGEKYQGKPTASGEPFDMYAYTAANRTLPFGTKIRVTNLKNNKSVEVRINDRGPTKKSRIVDLSYQAAKDIGLLRYGVVSVKIETISKTAQKQSYRESDNPYLTDEKSDQEYMKEYSYKAQKIEKSSDYNKYLSSNISPSQADNYTSSKPSSTSKRINVQISAFNSRKNAESFIDKQKDNGYNMKIIEIKRASKILYKVVIVCNSSTVAKRLIKSKRYSGAYILK